jgi:hypothetical protein
MFRQFRIGDVLDEKAVDTSDVAVVLIRRRLSGDTFRVPIPI